jgi:predicted Rdx family selenoprotein
LAASLQSRFGEEVQIKPGKTGQFDVIADGRQIFSKAASGRFPLDGEVEEIFAKLRQSH